MIPTSNLKYALTSPATSNTALCCKFGIRYLPRVLARIAALFFPVFAYSAVTYYAILLGIASHILMDMLNPQGVPLLYPLVKRNIRFLPKFLAPTTDAIGESVVRFAVLLVFVFVLYQAWAPMLEQLMRSRPTI